MTDGLGIWTVPSILEPSDRISLELESILMSEMLRPERWFKPRVSLDEAREEGRSGALYLSW